MSPFSALFVLTLISLQSVTNAQDYLWIIDPVDNGTTPNTTTNAPKVPVEPVAPTVTPAIIVYLLIALSIIVSIAFMFPKRASSQDQTPSTSPTDVQPSKIITTQPAATPVVTVPVMTANSLNSTIPPQPSMPNPFNPAVPMSSDKKGTLKV